MAAETKNGKLIETLEMCMEKLGIPFQMETTGQEGPDAEFVTFHFHNHNPQDLEAVLPKAACTWEIVNGKLDEIIIWNDDNLIS